MPTRESGTELERDLHQTDLVEARLDALKKLRRFRIITLTGIGVVALVVLELVTTRTEPALAQEGARVVGSKQAPLDELWVTGAIHLVDYDGRELAVLGREQGDGPVVMGLYGPDAEGPARQTLRLAASKSGAALSIRTPEGEASITALVNDQGPELELKRSSTRHLVTEVEPATRTVVASTLPVVGAARVAYSPEVEVAAARVQNIGDGFLVAQLNTDARPDGLRLSGRVINASSLKHRKVRFRITLAGQSDVIEIPLISPGNSTSFVRTFADVNLAKADSVRIEYLSSRVTYFGHSLRGIDGELIARSE